MYKFLKSILPITLFFIALLFFTEGFGQAMDTTSYFRIVTSDGNSYHGIIMEKAPEFVRLKTENLGEIKIRFIDIEVIERSYKYGEGSRTNRIVTGGISAHETNKSSNYRDAKNYFFRSTGYGLGKGEIYYQNVWLFFNELNFGITDNFSIGLGIMPFSFDGEIPAWMQAKFTLPIEEDKIAWGVGTVNGAIIGGFSNFGLFYTDITIGDRSNHVSIGVGSGYVDDDWQSKPAFSLSGSLKITRSGALITENYIFNEYLIYSFGFKQSFNKGAFNYGILYFEDAFEGVALPWIGLTFYLTDN